MQIPFLGWEDPLEKGSKLLQYSCLENPHGQRSFVATVHIVAESDMTEVSACVQVQEVTNEQDLPHTWKGLHELVGTPCSKRNKMKVCQEYYDNRCLHEFLCIYFCIYCICSYGYEAEDISKFLFPFVYTLKMIIMSSICYFPIICLSTRHFMFSYMNPNTLPLLPFYKPEH